MSKRSEAKVEKSVRDEIVKYGFKGAEHRHLLRSAQVERGFDISFRMLSWVGVSLVLTIAFNVISAGIIHVIFMAGAVTCFVMEIFYMVKWLWNYRPLKELK